MLKVLLTFAILFLGFGSPSGYIFAKETDTDSASKELNDPEMDCTKKVNLTLEQQNQLEQIYLRIHKDYSDLIHLYSQAGALTPYQTKIRHIMLHNYIKTFYKRNYRWCSEHESDEWEEEWYNNDQD